MVVTDLKFLSDSSGSYSDNLQDYQTQIAVTVNRLSNPNLSRIFGADVQFGVSSFVDKPISPFGSSAAGDFVYQNNLALTSDVEAVKTTVDGLNIFNGADEEEAQLEALLQTSLDSSVGYRSGSSRIVFLATDADYHVAGDGLGVGPITRPNDGDSIIEIDEDYPDIDQVKKVIEDNDIEPVFFVTSGVKGIYDDLVTQLGRGIVLIDDSNGATISDALKFAVAKVNGTITDEGTTGNDSLVITSSNPVVFSGDGNDNVFVTTSTPAFIDGGAGFDQLFGGIGSDDIDGGTGNDGLLGGDGNDTLIGGFGDDNISGQDGNDYLQGDAGNDALNGGGGADQFGFATGLTFDIADLGRDTISNFTPGTDKILLSKITFNDLTSSAGTLSSADFGTGNPITYDIGSGDIAYQGEVFANLLNRESLTASDFEVVNF